jgi:hypothetical protein
MEALNVLTKALSKIGLLPMVAMTFGRKPNFCSSASLN